MARTERRGGMAGLLLNYAMDNAVTEKRASPRFVFAPPRMVGSTYRAWFVICRSHRA
jgi:hypothetical protein